MVSAPTIELARSYLEQFNTNERFAVGERALTWLFSALPKNQAKADVLLKVIVLNQAVFNPSISSA
jgi:hypothetical protein